jgi:single-strand DNA-binding protein
MAGINKVILVGNLGKDPEVKNLENGAKVANFTLATSETYKNREGQKVTQTEWHNIVLWRGLAEIAEKYLHKGNQVYIEGKIKTRSWDDKDGVKRYTTEILGDNLTMLGGKRDSDDSAPSAPAAASTAPEAKAGDEKDDLPF